VVITGCTEGMGKEDVLIFAKKGFGVVLCARNKDKLEKTVKWIEG
jgi:short-subunit dehydrogenase